MLYLRKYVMLLRNGAKSRVVSFHLHSSSYESANFPSCGGYAYRYVHHGVDQTHLQPKNHAVTCMRTFGTMVSESSIDDIDHKLMSLCDDVKNFQFPADNLKKIVKFCTANDYQLNHSTGLLLLKCCGNLLPDLKTTDKQILADQVWCLVKKNSKELTLEHYNTMLDIYIKNSITVDPNLFLANMNLDPDKNTYRLLLNAVAKMDNSEHLQNIIYMIKNKNIAIDEDMFNESLQTYVNSDNIAKAEDLITLIQTAKLPATKIYTELACGYAKLGDIPNLVKILNDEPQNNQDLLRITKVLSMSGNSMHIPVVLNFLTVSVPEYNSEISKTISELIRANRVADAHTIINCLMTNNAIKNDVKCFVNNFLNELVIMNAPFNDIMEYTNNFMDSGYYSMALISLAEIGLKLGRENLCLAIFKVMRDRGIEIRPHYFWPLLIIARCKEGEAKIFALIKSMVDLGVELDFDTFINYVYPYVNTVNPITLMQRLVVKNNVPGPIAYTPLIAFLLFRNRLQDTESMYRNSTQYTIYCKDLMKPLTLAYLATRNIENCVKLLMLLSHGPDFVGYFLASLLNDKSIMYTDLKFILEELKKHDAKIPQQDADNLINKLTNRDLSNAENMKVSKLIKSLVDDRMEGSALSLFLHPKYFNKNELICYLVELKSKGINCRGTLRKLLIIYCNENNLKKVEEIKREFDAHQYNWTYGMKTHMFKLYLVHNKLAEAEALLSDLQASSKNFVMDNNKIVMFATTLVKAGNIMKAFKVIETVDNNMNNNCQKHCCILLQTLAHSEHYSYTKDMLALLLEKRYCDLKTELLRPLVAIPLERNDILGALDVFMKCVQKYNKIPLALQILTALLKNKDNPKLPDAKKYIEDVYQIIINISGVLVANTLLIIALATLNKTQELQAILQKESISMVCLSHYYNYAQNNVDEIDALWTLLKAAPNTSNLDQPLLCEMLLTFYNKTGNCNRALELWKVMCEKNIKPTKPFEHNFTQFLLVNKILIPPEFEQHQSKINVNVQ